MRSAACRRRAAAKLLRDLLERDGRAPADLDYVSSPLGRARETMELMRATLGLPAGRLSHRCAADEIAFGDWEGLTYQDVLARDSEVVAERERDKWGFRPPGGESYEQLAVRVGAWYATVERDTVVVGARRHRTRADRPSRHRRRRKRPPITPIEQGVVYVFDDKTMTRYA